MADGKEGGFTKLMPEGTLTDIFSASQSYKERGNGLVVFAGRRLRHGEFERLGSQRNRTPRRSCGSR